MMRNIKVPLHHQAGDITIYTASRAGISLYNVSVHTAHAGPQTSFSTAVLLYSFFFFFCCHAGINPELLCCVCRHHHTIHGRFGLSANAVLYRLPVITADDIPHKFDYRHTYTHTERETIEKLQGSCSRNNNCLIVPYAL